MSLPAHPAALSGPTTSTVEPRAPLAGPPGEAPRTFALHLRGTERDCARARRFTAGALARWHVDDCRDDALVVVSELVANAVQHARPDAPGAGPGVRLRLTLRTAHLLCAVTDPGAALPACPQVTDPFHDRGRGLHIVDALSEHWGWTRSAPAGKTVWAMLPIRAGAARDSALKA
ncbi:ATP-binding protein [Streptomyces sp. 7R007]